MKRQRRMKIRYGNLSRSARRGICRVMAKIGPDEWGYHGGSLYLHHEFRAAQRLSEAGVAVFAQVKPNWSVTLGGSSYPFREIEGRWASHAEELRRNRGLLPHRRLLTGRVRR